MKGKKSILKYPNGGKVKPIVVNDPNDPRLKAYNDSLFVYNKYKDKEEWKGGKNVLKFQIPEEKDEYNRLDNLIKNSEKKQWAEEDSLWADSNFKKLSEKQQLQKLKTIADKYTNSKDYQDMVARLQYLNTSNTVREKAKFTPKWFDNKNFTERGLNPISWDKQEQKNVSGNFNTVQNKYGTVINKNLPVINNQTQKVVKYSPNFQEPVQPVIYNPITKQTTTAEQIKPLYQSPQLTMPKRLELSMNKPNVPVVEPNNQNPPPTFKQGRKFMRESGVNKDTQSFNRLPGWYEEGGKVNPLEADIISNVIMSRNRDKNFVNRAYALGQNPGMFTLQDPENFGDVMSHKMAWGTDDAGQAYMYPTIMNPNNEAIRVPNQYADYISSEGYKKATGMEYAYGGKINNMKKRTLKKYQYSYGGLTATDLNKYELGGSNLGNAAKIKPYDFSKLTSGLGGGSTSAATTGATVSPAAVGAGIGFGAEIIGGLIPDKNYTDSEGNDLGNRKSIGESALEYGAKGAGITAMLGGADFGLATALGAGYGAVKGWMEKDEMDEKQKEANRLINQRNERKRLNTNVNWGDPSVNTSTNMMFAQGGMVLDYDDPNANAELELQETFQMPDGTVGNVDGPSHEMGGIAVDLPEGTRIWSDKLKHNGKTFAKHTKPITNKIARLEKQIAKNPANSEAKENSIALLNDQLDYYFDTQETNKQNNEMKRTFKNGGMIKRADGSYSKRGLWDNIRANRGSGKKPTPEMLKQEAKIKAEMEMGGYMYPMGGSLMEDNMFAEGGYTVRRSNDRKGKTHVVIGPDGTKKYFGDPNLGERGKSKYGKEAFYARHKKNLDKNPYFRAYAKATWEEGGTTPKFNYNNSEIDQRTGRPTGKGGLEDASLDLLNIITAPLALTNLYKAGKIGYDAYRLAKPGVINLSKTYYPTYRKALSQAGKAISPFEDGGMMGEEYAEGGIHIKPENKGKFTAYAKSHGKGVQEMARTVLANKENYSPTIVKRANFAKNAAGWKHEMGGLVKYELAGEIGNPYDPFNQPNEHAAWENQNKPIVANTLAEVKPFTPRVTVDQINKTAGMNVVTPVDQVVPQLGSSANPYEMEEEPNVGFFNKAGQFIANNPGLIGQLGTATSSAATQMNRINKLAKPRTLADVRLSDKIANPNLVDYSAERNAIDRAALNAMSDAQRGFGSSAAAQAFKNKARLNQLEGTGRSFQGQENTNAQIRNQFLNARNEAAMREAMMNNEIAKYNLENVYGYDVMTTAQKNAITAMLANTAGKTFGKQTDYANQMEQAKILANARERSVNANTVIGSNYEKSYFDSLTPEQKILHNRQRTDLGLPAMKYGGTIKKRSFRK